VENNFFTSLLNDLTNWEISETPDLLFCSCFGHQHRRYDCKKIFYTGENWLPNPWAYDFFFSFQPGGLHQRNYRLPVWVIESGYDWSSPAFTRSPNRLAFEERRFCNFLYGNHHAKVRQHFFHLLNQRIPVDSAGRVLRNTDIKVGPAHEDKLRFLGGYRFTIAFENESFPHYSTEKLIQPLLAGSVPIYWGDPLATRDLNPEAIINCHDFPDLRAVAEHVCHINENPQLWEKRVLAHPFKNQRTPDFALKSNAVRQLQWIIAQPRRIRPSSLSSGLAIMADITHRLLRIRRAPGFRPLMRLAAKLWPRIAA
jgi:hypothetical protein